MTDGFSIRPYEEGDLSSVITVWQACELTRPWNDPAHDIDFCVRSQTSALFVGVRDDALIATIMTGHDGHRGVIYYLGVTPGLQGKDFGRRMVSHAEDWLRQLGVWKVNLMIRDDNEMVRQFYQAIGYEEEPRVVMSRRIKELP